MLYGLPRSDNYGNDVCAFCHYWEGFARLVHKETRKGVNR